MGRTGPGDGLAEAAAAAIRERSSVEPRGAVILGSGLGEAAAGLKVDAEVPFGEIPGFPAPTVPGHEGRLALGWLAGTPVAAFGGRVHFYEGHPMPLVTLPVRLAAELGARAVVVTAAAGGLDPAHAPGTVVVGEDHLNFLGENPLRGWRDERGAPTFVELAEAYDAALAELAMEAAREAGVPAARGVYAAVAGPTFETEAETRFLRASGATVVGMSVVPEVAAARALGLRVVGLFCVTNRVGVGVTHEEVLAVAGRTAPAIGAVLERVLAAI